MAFERLKAKWQDLSQRKTNLIEEYGMVAVLTLFALSLPIYVGFFWVKWREGSMNGTSDFLTTAGLAWATTRATLPLRIVAAIALTPFVAKVVRRKPKASP